MARILVVDDETSMRRVLALLLREGGHAVAEAAGVKEALSAVESGTLDLVITDQRMPDGSGLDVLAACAEADPALAVVLLTAYATVELAVDAMRAGAFDFIAKPFRPEVVRAVVKRAVDHVELVRENGLLKDEIRRLGASDEILGRSASVLDLREKIARVAPTNATVLITGETGTGKELVARAIHRGSPRASNAFVAINCAAFPESLLESELFGHEKGAFTGADRARPGLFETAHRGTLLLDEAGEMPLALQAKLLRVLTDNQILRVGARTPRTVDVRIVAATHRDLPQRVAEGLFREDLYYRVAVVPIAVPPLRERPEDIPLLVEYFLSRAARDMNTPARTIEPAALRKLTHYRFPGNVRELRNLIERACILATGDRIGSEDFLLGTGDGAGSSPADPEPARSWIDSLPERLELRTTLEQIERDLIVRALETAAGVQAEAARCLGISRSDLAYKMRKYEIPAAGAR
jgi:DNA-binding NtrC family response regulator